MAFPGILVIGLVVIALGIAAIIYFWRGD